MKTVFSQFGTILEVNIPRKPGTCQPLFCVDLRSTADAREINALWGLFHSERAPDLSVTRLFPLWGSVTAPAPDSERHWSLLKGLLAYDRTPSGSRRLRVLWIPLPLSSSSPSSLSSPSSPSRP